MSTTAPDTVVFNRANAPDLAPTVARIIGETPVLDMHTHLYAPAFGELLLYGVDELMTYHYLIAEVLRVAPIAPDAFYTMPKHEQADLIWRELFLERSPISEACRGVLTVFDKLGLDVSGGSLDAAREAVADADPSAHIDRVFEAANISAAIMTNDPFDDTERPVWEAGYTPDPRFHAALRIDPLLNDWLVTCRRLAGWGYGVDEGLGPDTRAEVRRFLTDWLTRMDARYMAVSLPPEFAYPEESARATLIAECVLPAAREAGVPFAMMIGVTRQVNPALRLAGDGVGRADLGAVHRLCEAFPENKFLLTLLSRENQHEACVAARKFPNLFLFGCWWFLNNPSLIEEMTRMRMELLGFSMLPQHSDARVLEQVIYKWTHSRDIIWRVLMDKYNDMLHAGWTLDEAAIRRDVKRLLGRSFTEFCEGR